MHTSVHENYFGVHKICLGVHEIEFETYTGYSLVEDNQQKKVWSVLNVVLKFTLDILGL